MVGILFTGISTLRFHINFCLLQGNSEDARAKGFLSGVGDRQKSSAVCFIWPYCLEFSPQQATTVCGQLARLVELSFSPIFVIEDGPQHIHPPRMNKGRHCFTTRLLH